MPFPLLLLLALLIFVLVAVVTGAGRDLRATMVSAGRRASSAPERVGPEVVVPLVLLVVFIVAVEVVAFRFWDYLRATAVF